MKKLLIFITLIITFSVISAQTFTTDTLRSNQIKNYSGNGIELQGYNVNRDSNSIINIDNKGISYNDDYSGRWITVRFIPDIGYISTNYLNKITGIGFNRNKLFVDSSGILKAVNGLRYNNTLRYLGIGTIDPARKLHLDNGPGMSTYVLFTAGTNTGTTAYDGIKFGIDSAGAGRVWHYENQPLIFGVNNTETMRISASGELLINNISDKGVYPLQINGNVYATEYVAFGGISIKGTSIDFIYSTTTNGAIGFNSRSATTGSQAILTITSQGGKSSTSSQNAGSLIFQNGISTGSGTSQIILNRNTRSTGTTDNTRTSALIIPSQKTLLDATNDTLFSISLPTLAMAGGTLRYSVTATNGTDMQVHAGHVNFAAVNKGGVYTTEIVDESNIDDANANSSGTLTETWSIATGTNTIYIITNFDSSLNPAAGNMKCYFEIHNGSLQTITLF